MILADRRDQIFGTWRNATDTRERENQWYALRQLDELAGAIKDAIREYGGSRND